MRGQELKEEFIKLLKRAYSEKEQPNATIKFRFNTYLGYDIKPFTVHIIFNSFVINGVSLDSLEINNQILVIVSNMYYDHFSFKDFKHIKGKSSCHGHGDFYGCDKFLIDFFRYEQD